MKNHLVRKSNYLVEASYKLSAIEQKLVLILASMIKPDDQEFKKYAFQLKEVFAFLDLSSKNAYTYMKEVTKSLLGKVFTVRLHDSLLQTHWISSAHYHEGEGVVEFCFDPQLKPFLLQLKERFTTYKLHEVVQFKSSFSIRMYELLKQYEKIGSRTFEISTLRHILGLEEQQYRLYADFKKRVILVAQEELAEKSDISFCFEEIKVGHAVGKIKINITTRPRAEPLPLSSFPLSNDVKTAIIPENPEFLKLLELIPVTFRQKDSVKKAVKKAFESHGFDFVMRNIVYSNEKSNAVKPRSNLSKGSNYRVYLSKALQADYGLAYQEDREAKKESEEKRRHSSRESDQKRDAERAAILIEQENRENARVFMKSLDSSAIKTLEETARSRMSSESQARLDRQNIIGQFEFKRKMEEVAMEMMGIQKPQTETEIVQATTNQG